MFALVLIDLSFSEKIVGDTKDRKNSPSSCIKCIDFTTKIAQVCRRPQVFWGQNEFLLEVKFD